MPKSLRSSDTAAPAGLRDRAEAKWCEQQAGAAPPPASADSQRLIHELEVHQIELELQNEELQRVRGELEETLERISDLFDFAPVGYLTLDRAGVIREANLAAATILGVTRSGLVNRSIGRYVAPKARHLFDGFLMRVFTNQSREACEVTLVVEGRPPLEVKLEAVVSDSGRACKVALTDLTESKRAEEDRLVLSKLESTGILAGGIAHDFNNLLTALILNLDLAWTLAPSEGELAGCLASAKKTAFQARGLTQQLLTFSKGGTPLLKVTALPELIRDAARPAVSGSQARCDFCLAEDLWPVMADEGQIAQVIRNMVFNAREAMPAGGAVSIRAENVTRLTPDMPALPPGGYVRVSIADRGVGIPAEDLPKIFDPYFSTKERGERKGMGLGLTICHTIVQKHGGAITVKSVPGDGTTFDVYLPAAPQTTESAEAPAPPPPRSQHRILVMDDEQTVREVCGKTLRRMGHEVEAVEEGKLAVEAYAAAKKEGRPFDAVLLDLTIRDGMGGRAALEALREIDPEVKAIVMSGYADDPVVEQYGSHGFAGALVKPFDIERLRRVLIGVLAEARP